MLRRVFNPRQPSLPVLGFMAAVCAWFVHSRLMRSEEPTTTNGPVWVPVLREADQSYTLVDGAVRYEIGAPPSDTAESAPGAVDSLNIRQAYERANRLAAQTRGRVFKSTITPHWFADNTLFWYRNDLKDGEREFILVNAKKGTRRLAFNHAKLAAGLGKASGTRYEATKLPFDRIDFTDGTKAVRFGASGKTWQCDLSTYECRPVSKGDSVPMGVRQAFLAAGAGCQGLWALAVLAGTRPEVSSPQPASADGQDEENLEPPAVLDEDPSHEQTAQVQKKKGKKGFGFGPPASREARSPDGKWTAFTKDNNLFVRNSDGHEIGITTNGVPGNGFSALTWSPDSTTIIAYRTQPGDAKQVYMIESSPRDQLPAKVHTRAYPRPGDKFALHEMWLVQVGDLKPIKADIEPIDDFRGIPRLRWSKDRRRFTFEKNDRGHQRFRLVEVDAATGKTRNLIDEKTNTFIWALHPPRDNQIAGIYLNYLDDSDEIIYVSQRDGWKHVYLIDAKSGTIKQQITRGEWVVRAIDRVDVEARQIWFRASGKHADRDPYLIHHYRVNFDGSGLVALTEGNGNHAVQYSPDRKYLIDTYSRVDMPPVHELRRVSDGALVCKLDEADVSALLATGWRPPEVFVANGRDGTTDIWGIVCRPQNYDEKKKYPVIEMIYAGPHDAHVPKTFSAYRPLQALAELGFIVVQCDGMGTAHRSRAFHDVCWNNLADAGLPDRICWIKALAKRYAYVDITRVGIYGTSAGGQSSTGALLFHPEFYKVAVSSCGCHDNRLDKVTWNEQWMGLMGPHYEQQSNVTNAHKLQGKLLLIVGELDTNVPFESTMRVVDALIRAGKDFDLIFVPGMGHSGGGVYGERRRWDFFVRHLHGIEPPARNTAQAAGRR